ncbi:MAG: Hsp20/alpha crystallin family protein [Candidatus Hydrogenedentes bacterium]|nr:Hsp20/alpha crystallin family protein [Candidatus Hydrogenedentota bacterium]
MRHFEYYVSRMYSVLGNMHGGGRTGHLPSTTWQPPVDVYEREDGVVVVVELPGVDKDQISVVVDGGVLKVSGVRPTRVPDGTRHVHQMEIPYGHFARWLQLPPGSKDEQIRAQYEDGYLVIEIPHAAGPLTDGGEQEPPEEA